MSGLTTINDDGRSISQQSEYESAPLLSQPGYEGSVSRYSNYSTMTSSIASSHPLDESDDESAWSELHHRDAAEAEARLNNTDKTNDSAAESISSDEINTSSASPTQESMPLLTIGAILSTAFSYGCIMTTLFVITLPVECDRIGRTHPHFPKSVSLGIFVALAGLTQLVSPLVGRLSDMYVPPKERELGRRLPYLVLGAALTVCGLLGQMAASYYAIWLRYSFAFFMHMIGLTIMYGMMMALIPDQVPTHQIGKANGILAFLVVTGSLFGFGLFHSILSEEIQSMYGLYTCIVIVTTILTGTHAHERDAELAYMSLQRRQRDFSEAESFEADEVEDERSNHVLSGTLDSVPPSPQHKHKQKWKKAASKAAKKAQDIVLGPSIIIKSMLVDPFRFLNWKMILRSYTIDRVKYHDFYIVTVSRLFYYCGMSVQTFFLYFIHDIIGIHNNPEATVATLAMLGQCSGAITCYPIGVLSDHLGRQRKPFVYLACAILSGTTISLIFATTLHQMAIFCLVLGAANGMYLSMDTSLAVDTLPKDFGVDSESGSAQMLGIWGVAAFLGSALGPMIGGPLLYVVGTKVTKNNDTVDSADTTTDEYSLAGYAVVLSLSSFYFVCSAAMLFFIRSSSRTKP